MSTLSRYIAWESRCSRNLARPTAGDTHHLGALDYNQLSPCPNGLPVDTKRYEDCEATRRRVDKARRDIEHHRKDIRVQDLAEQITIEELQNDIKEIRKWVNLRHRSAAE